MLNQAVNLNIENISGRESRNFQSNLYFSYIFNNSSLKWYDFSTDK